VLIYVARLQFRLRVYRGKERCALVRRLVVRATCHGSKASAYPLVAILLWRLPTERRRDSLRSRGCKGLQNRGTAYSGYVDGLEWEASTTMLLQAPFGATFQGMNRLCACWKMKSSNVRLSRNGQTRAATLHEALQANVDVQQYRQSKLESPTFAVVNSYRLKRGNKSLGRLRFKITVVPRSRFA
jgi:hypothetical protein